jgi:hypothetical protein
MPCPIEPLAIVARAEKIPFHKTRSHLSERTGFRMRIPEPFLDCLGSPRTPRVVVRQPC